MCMRKAALWLAYVAVLIHFIKDITQDIFRISSPMDKFGNIEENISFLPVFLQKAYFYGLGGLSFLAEILLLVYLPKIIIERSTRTDRMIVRYSFLYLCLFLLLCAVLDPKINPFL
jgi:hypothetical protein